MRLRKVVRFGAWGIIVLTPLLGLFAVWGQVGFFFRHPPSLEAGEIISIAFSALAPLVLIVLFSLAVGGACLLIADIHERLHKEA